MSQNQADRFKTRLFIALLALLVWLPLPIGSEYPWAIAVAESWLLLLVVFTLFYQQQSGQPIPQAMKRAKPVLLLLFGYVFWLWLQTMPIPVSILALISPYASALHVSADPTVSFATISIAPYETGQKLIEALFLTLLFTLLLYLVDNRTKVKWLIYTLLLIALAEMLYGTLMVLTGIEYTFFLSKADFLYAHIGSASGTFHSRNSFAAYLEIALALGIGYLLSLLAKGGSHGNWKHKTRSWIELLLGPKMRLRLLLILLCLGLVMSHSRGGNIAFFASLGIAGTLFLIFASKKPRATVLFLTSLIVLDIVLIGSWVGLSKVMTRLEQTSQQKEIRDDLYKASMPIMQDYLITGAGAGSFYQLFPAYKSDALKRFGEKVPRVFNDSIQIIVETGIIGFSMLAGVVLYCGMLAIRVLRRRRSSLKHGLAFASLMGISAIVIHSMVDYPLQILSTSSMFMVLLALPFICSNIKERSGKLFQSDRSSQVA